MYERQYRVHQVYGTGKYAQHANRDTYGPFGSHTDVFIFVLITDPVVERNPTNGDKHKHADKVHDDVLPKIINQ